jgi:hypothetical protein
MARRDLMVTAGSLRTELGVRRAGSSTFVRSRAGRVLAVLHSGVVVEDPAAAFFALPLRQVAVVMIDFQNGFCSPDAIGSGQAPEVRTRRRFTGPRRENQRLAEQPPGDIEGVLVIGASARRLGCRAVMPPAAGPGSGHDDLAFVMQS